MIGKGETVLGFDRDTKIVRIPVTFTDAGMLMLDGRSLPKIREGSRGELLLNEYAVEDRELVKGFQFQATIPMLSAGQSVFFTVQAHQVPSELWKQAKQERHLVDGPEGPCVQVRLEDVLKLRLRGSKTPALCGCKCKIPCLGDKVAVSLNHAYTLISSHFEKDRISHSGNVFRLGWWYDEKQKRWVSLDELRTTIQGQREDEWENLKSS
jgi:hypothetical protein